MNKQLKAGLLLASAFLLVACGSNEPEQPVESEPTESTTVQESETTNAEPTPSNYVYKTGDFEVASDEQVNQFKEFVTSQSELVDRQVTQHNVLQIPESDLREDEDTMIEKFGTTTEEGYDVTTAHVVKTMAGDAEEVYSETLYLGEANILEHVKQVGGGVYTSVDGLMTLPEALLSDTPNIKQVIEEQVEDGLAERLETFKDKYKGTWIGEQIDYSLHLNDTYTGYYKGLANYLDTAVEADQYKVDQNKLYLELDPVQALDLETVIAEEGGMIDILYLDNDTSYIIEFDLDSQSFSVYRPDSVTERQIKATLTLSNDELNIVAPSDAETITDIDAYSSDYEAMFKFKQVEEESTTPIEAVEGPVNPEYEGE